ncbi:MAG: type II toxin-antitoxin system prevent-host-death family antitoxin [Kineosporiaceae bacterium]
MMTITDTEYSDDVTVTGVWSIAEAEARVSTLVARAVSSGPQRITRNGCETAVVVSVAEWHRRTSRRGTLADFFDTSPLRDSGLAVDRAPGGVREPVL